MCEVSLSFKPLELKLQQPEIKIFLGWGLQATYAHLCSSQFKSIFESLKWPPALNFNTLQVSSLCLESDAIAAPRRVDVQCSIRVALCQHFLRSDCSKCKTRTRRTRTKQLECCEGHPFQTIEQLERCPKKCAESAC